LASIRALTPEAPCRCARVICCQADDRVHPGRCSRRARLKRMSVSEPAPPAYPSRECDSVSQCPTVRPRSGRVPSIRSYGRRFRQRMGGAFGRSHTRTSCSSRVSSTLCRLEEIFLKGQWTDGDGARGKHGGQNGDQPSHRRAPHSATAESVSTAALTPDQGGREDRPACVCRLFRTP
jgi:hypothetical protein